MDIKEKIEKLTEEVQKHQYLYYVKAAPVISDIEYDRLYDELLELEKKYPEYASANSPTQRVGSDLDNTFPEKPHSVPVLSLDKEYNIPALEKWINKTIANARKKLSFVVEEKIDGASIVLYYKNGKLDTALTRGNGLVGNDVTRNIRTIREIPLVTQETSDFAIRGEIFLRKSEFAIYNATFDNKFANPRNLTAGSLRNLKSSVVAKIPLKIFAYEGYFNPPFTNDHIMILARLKEDDFKINKNIGYFSNDNNMRSLVNEKLPEITIGGIHELSGYIKERMQQRDKLDYEIDGMVIKANELDVRDKLGYTAHHPRWAIAFKFDAPLAQTRIKDIHIQVGRNGRVTPVAILEPVKISGSTVSRATLHNQEYIEMLELGIGDTVSISKRGDIIPAVEKVVEKDLENPTIFKFPQECPFCHSILVKDGGHHFCRNRECPERLIRTLAHFVSKGQMDIDTLGEKTIIFMFNKGYIKTIPDLYKFNYDELLKEEGFQEKKVNNIKRNVEKSKKRPFRRVLTALGFDGLGTFAAAELIKNGYNSIDKIIAAAARGNVEEFSCIAGFGEITANLLINHFTDSQNLAVIEELKKLGLNFEEELPVKKKAAELPFNGQVWVITGSFENFQPRSKAADEIEMRGGKVASAVSSNTTHLLVGSAPGSKLQKAHELNVTVVDETQFLEMLK